MDGDRKPGIAARVLRMGYSKGITGGKLSLKSGPGLHRNTTPPFRKRSRPRAVSISQNINPSTGNHYPIHPDP